MRGTRPTSLNAVTRPAPVFTFTGFRRGCAKNFPRIYPSPGARTRRLLQPAARIHSATDWGVGIRPDDTSFSLITSPGVFSTS